jgi:predicted ester cyclase
LKITEQCRTFATFRVLFYFSKKLLTMKIFSPAILAFVFLFSNCKEAEKSAPVTAAKDTQLEIAARNKATFIKVNALYNEKKLDEATKFYASNFERKADKALPGQAGVKTRWEETHKLWPDHQAAIEQIIAEGDWVMLRGKATATHTQVVMGVKPTNKKMEIAFWEALRFDKEGLIVESWGTVDNFAVVQQLGLLPKAK